MTTLLLLLFLSYSSSAGSHFLQSCEWEDESCEIKDSIQYSYDGEDFIPLDLWTMTWITPKALTAAIKDLWKADKTKLKHMLNTSILNHIKNTYTSCLESLKYYMHYGRSFLLRTEPSVLPLQTSPVSFLAVGLNLDIAKLIKSDVEFFGSYTSTIPNLKRSSLNEKHSLKFFLTGTSGTTTFPEFWGITTLDDVEIGYCDSITRRAEPKQDWIRELIDKEPKLLQWYSQKCLGYQQQLKAFMNMFKQRLNQTEGSHVLQRMSGCEWDEESGETKGFLQYGYDGEDFIALDLQTMTWITPKAQAVVIKHLWDAKKSRIEYMKNYYLSECPKLVQEYMNYGRNFLQRKERPSVSLLQKTPSSLVSCHAAGFYPHRAKLFWRKDGEEIHEGVEKGLILPDNDGTFQMSSGLNVSLVKHEDWKRYDCVFQLSGLKEDIITTLDKTEIQTNWVSPSEYSVRHPAVGVVAAVLLLLVLGVCWIVFCSDVTCQFNIINIARQ